MTLLLQITGASLIGLAASHLVLARLLEWRLEATRLSALNARVFAVHAFFIAFVLAALGLLTCTRPDLLIAKSDLAQLLLGAIVAFWVCRLFVQSWVFDPVLWQGKSWRWAARLAAHSVWLTYTAIYGRLWLAQF